MLSKTRVIKRVILLISAVSLISCSSSGSDVDGDGGDVARPGANPGIINYACSTGNGSVASPFVICTAAGLDGVRNNLGAHYALGGDIDLSDYTVWEPIGTRDSEFAGTLNGCGHTITNMNADAIDYTGLFGYIKGGAVYNLHIKQAVVHANNYVGGIAGRINNSVISGCSFEGSVTGKNAVGGLAGRVYDSLIEASYSEGSVIAAGEAGGIAGYVFNNSEIINTQSLMAVSGQNYLGGIAGRTKDSSITMTYASKAITGTNSAGDRIGGIVGSADNTVIKNNIALNTGLSGQRLVNRISGEVITCDIGLNYALNMPVWGTQVEGEKGTVITNTESETQAAYNALGWMFGSGITAPWTIVEGNYPLLYFY